MLLLFSAEELLGNIGSKLNWKNMDFSDLWFLLMFSFRCAGVAFVRWMLPDFYCYVIHLHQD